MSGATEASIDAATEAGVAAREAGEEGSAPPVAETPEDLTA